MDPYYGDDPNRQLRLLRVLQQGPYFGQGAAVAASPQPPPGPRDTYATAMGVTPAVRLPDLGQPSEPVYPATRLSEYGPGPEESRYHGMVDTYLQSLTQPFRLPEDVPYTKREKLGMLAAREPWQREVIQREHEAPYQRALAEAQIGERRRASAAGIASDLEKAQSYERYRLARESGAGAGDYDYIDKVEKSQADAGNPDYPYSRPQWKALADFNARSAGKKLAGTRAQAMKQMDDQIRQEEDQILQARSDVMGMDLGTPLAADRQRILGDASKRRDAIAARRAAIAAMTEEVYQDFTTLTSDQQEQVFAAYQKRMAGQQGNPSQLGPVAPSPSYYP